MDLAFIAGLHGIHFVRFVLVMELPDPHPGTQKNDDSDQ